MNIRDATNEALDAIVRKAGTNMRDNNRKRLQEIAQEVAEHVPPIAPRPSPRLPIDHKESSRLFAEIRKRAGL